MWRTILMAVAFSVAVASCKSTGGGCPSLVDYSAETQRLAAAELRRLPKGSLLARMIVDYKKTRDACRAGAGAAP